MVVRLARSLSLRVQIVLVAIVRKELISFYSFSFFEFELEQDQSLVIQFWSLLAHRFSILLLF